MQPVRLPAAPCKQVSTARLLRPKPPRLVRVLPAPVPAPAHCQHAFSMAWRLVERPCRRQRSTGRAAAAGPGAGGPGCGAAAAGAAPVAVWLRCAGGVCFRCILRVPVLEPTAARLQPHPAAHAWHSLFPLVHMQATTISLCANTHMCLCRSALHSGCEPLPVLFRRPGRCIRLAGRSQGCAATRTLIL